MAIQVLNQWDKAWADVKIGSTNLPLKRWGCTITSLSMASQWYNEYTTPPEIAGHKDWFTYKVPNVEDGQIIWSKLRFKNFRFLKRFYKFDPADLDAALKNPRDTVLIEINNHSHWVLGLRKLGFGLYLIADPNGGKKRIIKSSQINGLAIFTRS
jgi:hypothetical protein